MSAYDDIFADFYSDNADLGISQFDAANSLANYVGVDPIETEPTYEGQQNTMGMYGEIEPTVPYEVVPERKMNIIQQNPYVAKEPPTSRSWNEPGGWGDTLMQWIPGVGPVYGGMRFLGGALDERLRPGTIWDWFK